LIEAERLVYSIFVSKAGIEIKFSITANDLCFLCNYISH